MVKGEAQAPITEFHLIVNWLTEVQRSSERRK
jgi:hypothetical protein